MKWFRFYSEVLDDPKVQRLPYEMRWRWAELLCLANSGSPRGRLPSLTDIGYRLRVSKTRATTIVDFLKERGLLDDIDGRLVPHGWDDRQPESDNAKERMRRTRSENVQNKFGLEQTRTEQNRTEEKRKETELLLVRRNIFVLYEQTFGLVNAAIQPVLEEAEDKYPPEWIEAAFKEAAENRARSWRYIEAILRRWEDDGPQEIEREAIDDDEQEAIEEAKRQAAIEWKEHLRTQAVSQRTS